MVGGVVGGGTTTSWKFSTEGPLSASNAFVATMGIEYVPDAVGVPDKTRSPFPSPLSVMPGGRVVPTWAETAGAGVPVAVATVRSTGVHPGSSIAER